MKNRMISFCHIFSRSAAVICPVWLSRSWFISLKKAFSSSGSLPMALIALIPLMDSTARLEICLM